jgi:hypothetical protein
MSTTLRFLSVLLFAAMFIIQPVVFAQTPVPADAAVTQKEGSGAGIIEDAPAEEADQLEYVLPYPGILPDHPLYFLKSMRDVIVNALISDPVKKAEFALLRSDKFIGMGTALAQKGRWELAADTLESSNAEMKKAVDVLTGQKNNSVTVPSHLVDSINRSISKHMDVISGIDADQTVSGRVQNVIDELGELQSSAQLLR